MEFEGKHHALSLGLRVGIVFLTTVLFVIIAAYYILSQNFQILLTDYSIQLVETLRNQGVTMVENELQNGRQEAMILADTFVVPEDGESVAFPDPYSKHNYIRMVYVSKTEVNASDGRIQDISAREDIVSAFDGEVSVYGPYYNDEEYIVCYSAPIKRNGEIIGVLSIEKDGYLFCELIKNIRFINSGESYIINAEGTDIAVSDHNHIDWVTSQYNARKLLEKEQTEETKSILELEQKGLNGETGLDTYIWHDGLVYVCYQPIPSVGWVLFAGMREEELVAMTQSAMINALSQGPILGICLGIVGMLTVLMIYWIVSSMKKTAEINKKLNVIANYDTLTGLMNRNCYHTALDELPKEELHSFACIYVDANGLHELNNHLGHEAGDDMLKAVANSLRSVFDFANVYRIGGDEFVVLCLDQEEEALNMLAQRVKEQLRRKQYEVSIGIAWQHHMKHTMSLINEAEAKMQQDKKQYYANNEQGRHMRVLDQHNQRIRLKKQEADTVLTMLAPELKGVYFVNLASDTMRYLYIPDYFEAYLKKCDNRFSKALLLYAKEMVKQEYDHRFTLLSDYEWLEKELNQNHTPTIYYQKVNGDWLKLCVLRMQEHTKDHNEALWIFTDCNVCEKEGADNEI